MEGAEPAELAAGVFCETVDMLDTQVVKAVRPIQARLLHPLSPPQLPLPALPSTLHRLPRRTDSGPSCRALSSNRKPDPRADGSRNTVGLTLEYSLTQRPSRPCCERAVLSGFSLPPSFPRFYSCWTKANQGPSLTARHDHTGQKPVMKEPKHRSAMNPPSLSNVRNREKRLAQLSPPAREARSKLCCFTN